MRTPNPNFTPQEAEQARAFLTEHASPVQQKLLDQHATDDDGGQLFLIVDHFDENDVRERGHGEVGEEGYYVTSNDELIVDFWRHLTGGTPAAFSLRRLLEEYGGQN